MDINLLIVAVYSYLLGSIPFGLLLAKIFLKKDIRTVGSGNIGTTNVLRREVSIIEINIIIIKAAKVKIRCFEKKK